MTHAEMRYMDNELHSFIEKFMDLGNYESSREAQKELAQRLENIPLGMLLNQPLKEERKKEEKKDRSSFLKV